MKEPADLDFTLELLSVEQPEEYKKEAWQMDAGEKMGEIPALREEGNRLYMERRVDEAEEKYKTAIGMLEQLMLRYCTEWNTREIGCISGPHSVGPSLFLKFKM